MHLRRLYRKGQYHLYAKDTAESLPILGFHVFDNNEGELWNGREQDQILTLKTALAEFREASRANTPDRDYVIGPVYEGDCDQYLYEHGEPEGHMVGFQVRNKDGKFWANRPSNVALAFRIAINELLDAEEAEPEGEWDLVVILEGQIPGAEYLTDIVRPSNG